ncbi:hypothetical protein B0H19DRAFT_1259081 [Mycena capillaripes]|nr:hypothetical protein B0H19DRAFT_1259081 [Mycena capillaripes]
MRNVVVSGNGISATDMHMQPLLLQGGNTAMRNLPLTDCKVPAGTNGPVALWITNNKPLSGDVTTCHRRPGCWARHLLCRHLARGVRTNGSPEDWMGNERNLEMPHAVMIT